MPKGKPVDLTGRRFGHWTVIERAGSAKYRMPLWKCRCICGTETDIRANNLMTGKSTKCRACADKSRSAALRGRKRRRSNSPDLTGQTFGSWKVLERVERTDPQGAVFWKCRCICGTEAEVRGTSLTSHRSTGCRSCGQVKAWFTRVVKSYFEESSPP